MGQAYKSHSNDQTLDLKSFTFEIEIERDFAVLWLSFILRSLMVLGKSRIIFMMATPSLA